MKNTEYLSYCRLLKELKNFLCSVYEHVETALLYGSLSRNEIVVGLSDIDILIVISDNVLSSDFAHLISDNVINLQKKYGIRVHFRLRNLYDLWNHTSGFQDSGITSIINKLRDGQLILGRSLDNLYLESILASSDDEIKRNIQYRLSELKYQIRSNITSIDQSYFRIPQIYKFGSLVSQFAELVCYSHGRHFFNRFNAIKQADEILNTSWIRIAKAIRMGEKDIDVFKYIPLIEEGTQYCINIMERSSVAGLRKIVIRHINDFSLISGTVLNRTNLMNSKGIFEVLKFSEVMNDGTLLIYSCHD